MAAIDFPTSPTNGQTFAAPNGVLYTYNGTIWVAGAQPLAGPPAFSANNAAQVNLGAAGTWTNVAAIGPLGVSGEKWRVDAGARVGNAAAAYDYCESRMLNGATPFGVQGFGLTVNGAEIFFGCFAIVTLSAAATFTLQARDGSTGNGYVPANGAWIVAQRVS